MFSSYTWRISKWLTILIFLAVILLAVFVVLELFKVTETNFPGHELKKEAQPSIASYVVEKNEELLLNNEEPKSEGKMKKIIKSKKKAPLRPLKYWKH